jgi:hypothetical protein
MGEKGYKDKLKSLTPQQKQTLSQVDLMYSIDMINDQDVMHTLKEYDMSFLPYGMLIFNRGRLREHIDLPGIFE